MLKIVELFYDFGISTLVGLFGIHLLLKKGLLASKFLALYFLLFSFRIVIAYFSTDGRLVEFPQLVHAYSPVHFLSPVISFLFVYFMLYPHRKLSKRHGLLFLPFVLHLSEMIPFFFGPLEYKIKEVELILKYQSLVNYPGQLSVFSPFVLSIIKVLYTATLDIASFVLVLDFIRKNKSFKGFLLSWLFCFTALSLISMVFIIAYVTGIIGFNKLRFSYADLLMHLAAFVNLCFVLYRPSLLDGVSFKSLVIRLHENARHPLVGLDAIKIKKYEVYASRLEELFANEKVFLDTALTLEKVAKKIAISTKELSRTTSYIYELSFPDFVNSWRINYILEMRKENIAWQSHSQEQLAEMSGFGSRQGLNNAVKRLYGMTLVDYIASKA